MDSTIRGSTKVILNVDELITAIKFLGLDEESLQKVIRTIFLYTLLFYDKQVVPDYVRENDWLPFAKNDITRSIKQQIFNQSIVNWEVDL